mgnify:CR=1 FL=1|jgi:Na+/melibiose symporter-like transporter
MSYAGLVLILVFCGVGLLVTLILTIIFLASGKKKSGTTMGILGAFFLVCVLLAVTEVSKKVSTQTKKVFDKIEKDLKKDRKTDTLKWEESSLESPVHNL